MEHYYSKIRDESYFSFEDVYKRMVQRFPSGSVFVEVGVLHGKSLAFLGVEIVNSGKSIQVVGVDSFNWHSGQHAKLVENLRPLEAMTPPPVIWTGMSHEVANEYADQSVDFVFIDACHDYEYVKRDIECWLPKVRVGGVIAGHDYDAGSFPGVVRAVDDKFGDRVRFSPHTCWEHDVTEDDVCRE